MSNEKMEIEITLAHNSVIFERAVFSDIDAATDYAFAKMHHHTAHVPPSYRDRPH